ncbi:MAG: hypothetical protein ACYC5K_02475 [Saccharofermentanales bacterium]
MMAGDYEPMYWHCPKCSEYVLVGSYHFCAQYPRVYQKPQGDEILERLDKIIELLQKLARCK